MTIARRLLIAGGGGGAFTPPAGTPFSVIDAPSVGWTEVLGPHAAYASGRTYIGGVGGNSNVNDILVYAYVHATDTVEGPMLLWDNLAGETSPDSHNAPAVLVRDDGYIVVAFVGHNQGTLRVKISNDPWDITAGFGSNITANSSGTMTYPMLAQLGTRIWLVWRDRSGAGARLRRSYSDDGGASWSADENFYEVAADFVYGAHIGGSTRIDFAVTDKEPDAGDYGLWHFYMEEDGSVFQTDGTEFAGSYPLATSDLTEIVPTGNDSYPYAISYTGDGRPVIAAQSKAADPVEIMEYRWSGSAWARHDIDTSDPISGSILSVGGGAHDPGDSLRFITGKVIGGNQVMWLYTSGDDGATWTGSQLALLGTTPNSPVYVYNAGPELTWIWFVGNFTGSDDFDPGLEGIA